MFLIFFFFFLMIFSSCLQNQLAAYKQCLRAWALCRTLIVLKGTLNQGNLVPHLWYVFPTLPAFRCRLCRFPRHYRNSDRLGPNRRNAPRLLRSGVSICKSSFDLIIDFREYREMNSKTFTIFIFSKFMYFLFF